MRNILMALTLSVVNCVGVYAQTAEEMQAVIDAAITRNSASKDAGQSALDKAKARDNALANDQSSDNAKMREFQKNYETLYKKLSDLKSKYSLIHDYRLVPMIETAYTAMIEARDEYWKLDDAADLKKGLPLKERELLCLEGATSFTTRTFYSETPWEMKWNSDGANMVSFSVYTSQGEFAEMTSGPRGTRRYKAGNYYISVIALGAWTLTVTRKP